VPLKGKEPRFLGRSLESQRLHGRSQEDHQEAHPDLLRMKLDHVRRKVEWSEGD